MEVEVEVVESENKDLLFDRKCAIATPFILPPFNGEEKVPMSSKSPGVSDEEKQKRIGKRKRIIGRNKYFHEDLR